MIKLNYNFLMNEFIGNSGLEKIDIYSHKNLYNSAREKLFSKIKSKEIGFFDLPSNDKANQHKEILKYYQKNKSKFDNFVVLGIGGSSLGPLSLYKALNHTYNNIKNKKKFFVLDNPDPSTISDLLSTINLKRTLFNVISKSGTTIETISEFFIVKDKLLRAGKNLLKTNLVITTDPTKGPLRKFALTHGIKTFDIPPNIGGRYSVLSPVGLLPACFCGINIKELLAGAEAIRKNALRKDILKNKVLLFSLLIYLSYKKLRKPILALFPYSDKLKSLGEWFIQLWAESLGKRYDLSGNIVNVGQTPLNAVGAKDQHSILQLFIEGPYDKLIVFLEVEKAATDLKIPEDHEFQKFSYVANKKLSTLLNTEKNATSFALTKYEHPNITLKIPEISAYYMGQLIFFFETACAFLGFLYNINPFDQPGVELGKIFTKGLLGETISDEFLEELSEFDDQNKEYIL